MERGHQGEGVEGRRRKAKGMICGTGLDILQSSGEFPNCAACRTGVTSTADTGYIRM